MEDTSQYSDEMQSEAIYSRLQRSWSNPRSSTSTNEQTANIHPVSNQLSYHSVVSESMLQPMHLKRKDTFDRLYDEAFNTQRRINRSREILASQRQLSIKKSSFVEHMKQVPRPQFSYPARQGDTFHEKLYNNDVAWMSKRDENVKRKRVQLQHERDEQEAASIMKSPPLATSSYRSQFPQLSHDETFEALYQSREVYEQRAVQRAKRMSDERSVEMRFAPHINQRSVKLAEKKRHSHSQGMMSYHQQLDVSGYVSSSSLRRSDLEAVGSRAKSPTQWKLSSPSNNSMYSQRGSRSITPRSNRSTSSCHRSRTMSPSLPSSSHRKSAIAPDGTNLTISPTWGKRSNSAGSFMRSSSSRQSSSARSKGSKKAIHQPSPTSSSTLQRSSIKSSPGNIYLNLESPLGENQSSSKTKPSGPLSALIRYLLDESKHNLATNITSSTITSKYDDHCQHGDTTNASHNIQSVFDNEADDQNQPSDTTSPDDIQSHITNIVSNDILKSDDHIISEGDVTTSVIAAEPKLKVETSIPSGSATDPIQLIDCAILLSSSLHQLDDGNHDEVMDIMASHLNPSNTKSMIHDRLSISRIPVSSRRRSKSPCLISKLSLSVSIDSPRSCASTVMDEDRSFADVDVDDQSTGEVNLNLFDRLYQDREQYLQMLENAKNKHTKAFSHHPDIGINKYFQVEANKDDFFQRLYDHTKYQHKHIAKITEQVMRMERGDPIQLKEDDRIDLFNRLAVTDTQQRYMRSVDRKWFRNEEMDSIVPEHLIPQSSIDLSIKSSRKALSEIFDVLVLSADLSLTLCDEVTTSNINPTDIENSKQDDENTHEKAEHLKNMLDSGLAQPYLLKCLNLAEAMTIILDSVRPEKLTRERFIDLVESFMTTGKISPITSYLTSAPKHDQRMMKAIEPRSKHEESIYSKYILSSKEKSDELAKIKYDRNLVKTANICNLGSSDLSSVDMTITSPSVEDRLLAHRIIASDEREQLAKEVDLNRSRELTFSPNLSASKKSYKTIYSDHRQQTSS